MPEPALTKRFESALTAADPGRALYDLAKTLRDEGMSQLEMHRLYDHFRDKLQHDDNSPHYNAVLHTRDYIAGCGPRHVWIFGRQLTNNDEIPVPNDPLSPQELSFLAQLNEADLAKIDHAILSSAEKRFKKVAMVVIRAMEKVSAEYPDCTYTVMAERIRILAEQGKLESQGNLSYMRFSEVKLPGKTHRK